MYHLKFDPNGGPLIVQIDYYGSLTASYVYTLWAKNSNAKVDEQYGNNQNSQDDRFILPSPVSQNSGRIVEIFSTINNPDNSNARELVAIKILQDGNTLFTQENPGGSAVHGQVYTVVDEKIIPGETTTLSDPFINLIV